jgi:hypothetical protein
VSETSWCQFLALRKAGERNQVLPQLPKTQNIAIYPAMEKLFSDPAYKGFVLQDRKRLPSRFSARVCGALTSRLS